MPTTSLSLLRTVKLLLPELLHSPLDLPRQPFLVEVSLFIEHLPDGELD